jgi:hypothetical protein
MSSEPTLVHEQSVALLRAWDAMGIVSAPAPQLGEVVGMQLPSSEVSDGERGVGNWSLLCSMQTCQTQLCS